MQTSSYLFKYLSENFFGAFQELWLHQRCTNNWLEMC